MKKLIALAAVALVAIAASCDTENVGPGGPVFFSVSITGVTPADPAGLFGNEDATFAAAVTGGVPNYTYSWNFGGASTPSPSVSPAGTTTSITQTLTSSATPQTYTVTVTATDGNGLTATDTEVINVGATRNAPPVINSAVFNAAAKTLTVTVQDDDDGETLTVTVTPPAGFNVDATSKAAAATGPLTAVFNVSATDALAGATGNFGVSVSDGKADVTFTGGVDVTIAPLALVADTIYAVPTTGSAATGADVQVIVLTGATANPFQYMVGAGLTIESDATYTPLSFDTGAVDDNASPSQPIDGIWAAVGGTSFLLGDDSFIVSTDIGGGRERWDFNVTPLGGANVANATGALFNAKFTFATAGTKTFGFQDVQGVKRTYYADDATEYFWGDFSNDGSGGVPNSVTIN